MNMRAGVGQRHSPPQAARVGCPCTAGEEPRDHRLPARGQVPHRHPQALPRRPRPGDASAVQAHRQLRLGDDGRTRCASASSSAATSAGSWGRSARSSTARSSPSADPHRGQPSARAGSCSSTARSRTTTCTVAWTSSGCGASRAGATGSWSSRSAGISTCQTTFL